ncbi:copper resistance CopC/CopD family protein [Streptomyces resistomycificus]|uniref:Protein YobA n=1 Tax=Streptomyces resistomycificus TaxID=67356 RepID=A0A0L8L0L8_9ACTN|nr:copper resistance protein CopC [Streptomyces resistomycificus]KOG31630.1 transport integral membrane protein [Streptomyces resistomycificus]KUN97088.1 transporter [Streptomyces resistomycificus]
MLLGTVLVLLLLGSAGPASAHAALRDTDPADGTVLKSAPRHLTLTFTESVGLLEDSFRVLDPDNHRLRVSPARHAPEGSDTARVTLPAKLAEGTYVVAWRVVSADSHPVSGAFTFSVGKATITAATTDTGPVEDPATESLYNIARYLAYLAVALLIGSAVFLTVCRPPDAAPLRRLLRAGWLTLLGATLALLVLRAPYESGAGPAAALDPSALTRTLTTRPGLVLLARLALLVPAAVLLVRLPRRERPSRTWLAAGAALSAGLAVTWAAGEHASAGIQVPVAMTSSVLHVLATAVWLGGLTALLTSLYRSTSAFPPAVVARFSRLAFWSVVVLVVTGVYQSWRGLGSWSAFSDTTYGRLLVVKLLAVALLLAAAGLSRRWTARLVRAETETVAEERQVEERQAEERQAEERQRERERVAEPVGGPRPPAAPAEPDVPPAGPDVPPAGPDAPPVAAQDPHRSALRRSVLAEVGVGVAVLVITTVLTGTLPGRAAAEAAESAATSGLAVASVTTIPFDVGTPGGRGKVQITLDPGRTGDNAVEAVVYGPDNGISTVPELRLSFTLPAQDIGPIDAELTDRGGYWATGALNLPLAGDWRMKATVRVSEIDQVSETKTVRITG